MKNSPLAIAAAVPYLITVVIVLAGIASSKLSLVQVLGETPTMAWWLWLVVAIAIGGLLAVLLKERIKRSLSGPLIINFTAYSAIIALAAFLPVIWINIYQISFHMVFLVIEPIAFILFAIVYRRYFGQTPPVHLMIFLILVSCMVYGSVALLTLVTIGLSTA